MGARERDFDAEWFLAQRLEIIDYRLVINRRSRGINCPFRRFAQRPEQLPAGDDGSDQHDYAQVFERRWSAQNQCDQQRSGAEHAEAGDVFA